MDDINTKEETASYLKLSVRKVDMLVKEGKLKKSKQGRNTVFLRENIEKYVKECITDE